MNLPLSQIAEWTHAKGSFKPDDIALGYSIDSRTITPGELFFAVIGERVDGHDYVHAALDRGALAAVVRADWAAPQSIDPNRLLRVSGEADPVLTAMQTLAREVRRTWGRRVIGVTGSAGKTTTKEMVATVLSAKCNTLKTTGNLNNHFGVPLQLLRLQPEHEVAVIEMGMNHAGEIAALCRIAEPNWGVVSNVGTAHIEFFPDGMDGIARAKRELPASLPPNGIAFLNADDPRVRAMAEASEEPTPRKGTASTLPLRSLRKGMASVLPLRSLRKGTASVLPLRSLRKGTASAVPLRSTQTTGPLGPDGPTSTSLAARAVLYGTAPDSDIRAENIRQAGFDGVRFTVLAHGQRAEAHVRLLGRHNVLNALAAIAVGLQSGMDLATCAQAVGTMLPTEKRGNLIHWRGARIVNDTYNSNPAALDAMVDALLATEPGPGGRRIVVAGEMLELGTTGPDLHRACGLRMKEKQLDLIVGVRGLARHFGGTFLESPQQAGDWLAQNLRPNDIVLLKASRGVQLEQALEALGS